MLKADFDQLLIEAEFSGRNSVQFLDLDKHTQQLVIRALRQALKLIEKSYNTLDGLH